MSIPNSNIAVQALATQVGGHAGVLTTEDGSLLIKPALARELEFYQVLQNEKEPAFVALRRYTPKFLGTLTLEGEAAPTPEGELHILPVRERKDEFLSNNQAKSIVLENLSYRFTRPNILDVKLGQVLYDETANEDKVQRMIKTAKETTSWETGVRLTGFQVHDNYTQSPVNTPKSYGKSIKASDLPDGIARVFPVAHPESGTNGIDKEEGRQGLPPQILLPVLSEIYSEIAQIREALAGIEFRMVGGSILVIYESDWEKADEGIKRHLEGVAAANAKGSTTTEGDDEGEEEEDDEEDDDEEKGPPPAFIVKLIDFAHTRVEEGLGPDEGVLLGVDTVLNLLNGRIKQVKDKFNL